MTSRKDDAVSHHAPAGHERSGSTPTDLFGEFVAKGNAGVYRTDPELTKMFVQSSGVTSTSA